MTQLPPDLAQQIKHYLAVGQYQSEEDVLRDALRALAAEQQTLDTGGNRLGHTRQADR